ncbi:uncharacterized protein JN550_008582 [Neoarthrinium moseri]|uniref:uncharacterized protein n=1 Tax=Neoarthrinium moseri TaxID=1658444 RepID=UPI001FDAEC12|nr:uncharacterized protein JN550_008582 [Neoarthrinium moseri]KAI1865036.1 hypothetical protein JN550_008582 [Neoarthrinium moseri]
MASPASSRTSPKNPSQILHRPVILAVGAEDDRGTLTRVLVGRSIKYLFVSQDAFPHGWEYPNGPNPSLPTLDLGEKKIAEKLSGIQGLSHEVMLDYSDFSKVSAITKPWDMRSERLTIVNHPAVVRKAVMKIAEFPDFLPRNDSDKERLGKQESEMKREIQFHQEASSHGITTRFHGLVTEEGRGVIGYAMEFIEGGKSFSEIAKENKPLPEQEIQACLAVVRRLHEIGIYHGDLDLGNVMRRPDGTVLIIDFQYSARLGAKGSVEGMPIYSEANEVNGIERRLRNIGRGDADDSDIIPSAWLKATAWNGFRHKLDEAGYASELVALPTVGGREAPLAQLADDIATVQAVLARLKHEGRRILILCHSSGGLVASNAVVGFNVLGIIFLSAFMIPSGKALLDMLGGNPLPWMKVEGDRVRGVPAMIPQVAFNDMDEGSQQEWTKEMTHTSISLFVTPSAYEPWADGVPCGYIFCENDNSLPLPVQQQMAALIKSTTCTATIQSGHCPFLSKPDDLLEALRGIELNLGQST